MPIDDHLTEFEQLPVMDYSADAGLASPNDKAFRLSLSWDESDSGKTFIDLFAKFLADPKSTEVQALLVGAWGQVGTGIDSSQVVEALTSARDRLPRLRALFLGEITVDESEISWIEQSDVSPLFEAYPNLESLWLRGGNGLRLGRPRHERLRKLVVQTGGMSAAVVRDVTSADLPNLEHLELWLGDEGYGNDVSGDDIRKLLTEGPCRQLAYLGLRDDCHADETAAVLAEFGMPASLKVLDLSLGTLSDEGAAVLAKCNWLRQLTMLDIHFHYVSDKLIAQLKTLVAELDANGVQEPDVWDGASHRYVAVGE